MNRPEGFQVSQFARDKKKKKRWRKNWQEVEKIWSQNAVDKSGVRARRSK